MLPPDPTFTAPRPLPKDDRPPTRSGVLTSSSAASVSIELVRDTGKPLPQLKIEDKLPTFDDTGQRRRCARADQPAGTEREGPHTVRVELMRAVEPDPALEIVSVVRVAPYRSSDLRARGNRRSRCCPESWPRCR